MTPSSIFAPILGVTQYLIPPWAAAISAAAVLVTSIGVLYAKLVKPSHDQWKRVERIAITSAKTAEVFGTNLRLIETVGAIATRFQGADGESLSSALADLSKAADAAAVAAAEAKAAAASAATAAQVLAVNLAADRQLAIRDREEQARQLMQIDRLTVKVDGLITSVANVQAKAGVVAENLASAQSAVEGVAADLAESHRRADETGPGAPAGTAADAAMQQTESERDKNNPPS